MKQTSDYINEIVEALVEPDANLSEVLLKVKVIAHKLNNSILSEWIEKELQGYASGPVPEYRVVPSVVMGNVMQSYGFGQALHRRRMILPVDGIKGIAKNARKHEIRTSIFEIAHSSTTDGAIQVHLPAEIGHYIAHECLAPGCEVENCWKEIGKHSFLAILGSVKNHLLTLMLDLSSSIGELEKLEVTVKSKRIDEMVKNSIGHITAETVNVNFGEKVVQAGSSGSNNSVNAQAGDTSRMAVNPSTVEEVKKLIPEIAKELAAAPVGAADLKSIQDQLDILGSEVLSSAPRQGVLSAAFTTLYGLMLGVAGNVFTPVVMEGVGALAFKLADV